MLKVFWNDVAPIVVTACFTIIVGCLMQHFHIIDIHYLKHIDNLEHRVTVLESKIK